MPDAAGTPPPPEALAAILGPATQVVRRLAVYEQDGSTLYRGHEDVGLLDGSVSVDYARAERRTAQFTLENKDGSLVHEPGEFWYDKIIKVWRGVRYPTTEAIQARIISALNLTGASGSYASTPWAGSNPNGLSLNGVVNNLAHLPFHVDFDIVADIDIRAELSLDDWTPGVFMWIIGSYAGNNDNRFGLQVTAVGGLQFGHATSAHPWMVCDSTASVPAADGTKIWVRATYQADDGAGNRVYRFYTSLDGVVWTPLGAAVTVAGVLDIGTSPEPLTIGHTVNGLNALLGVVYKVQVREGIDGPLALDVDFTDKSHGWNAGDSNGTSGFDGTGKTVNLYGVGAVIRSTLDITGDIDLRVFDLTAADWTDAAYPHILSKMVNEGTGDGSWSLGFNPDGQPYVAFAVGAGAMYMTATAAMPVANGEGISLRFTLDVADGANKTGRFYTSTDHGETWTLLGAAITHAGNMRVKVSSANVKIGTTQGGVVNMFTGTLKDVEIRDGIDGRVVANPDFSDEDPGTTVFDDFEGNTWTVHAPASIIATDQSTPYIPAFYSEWLPQVGEFMLDEIVSQHFPHTIGVTARDYTKKCLTSKFKIPTAFVSGQPVEQVIKTIATNAGINPQKMILENTGQVTAKDWFFESGTERWKAMNDIAVNYGLELFFDANGNLVLRRFRDPSTSPAVHRFHTGEFGNLAGWQKSARDARLYNSVVVTGESANTTPVYGFATNNEPGSPISIDEIGERTMFYTSAFITTIAQATDVARKLLAIHGLEEYDINLASLVFPHLEAGEIIEFEEPAAGVNDPTRFLFSSFDIPLKLGPMNSVGKRVVIIT